MASCASKNGLMRQSGFTMIELMVVVTIVAFVMAAMVPSFSLTLQKNRQREAAMLIIQGVFAGRSRAARTGRCHRVNVFFDKPGIDGGTGGRVTLTEYNPASPPFDCGTASNNLGDPAQWRQISRKSLAPDAGRAGLVGTDVAILREVDAGDCATVVNGPNSSVDLLFESTGGLEATTAMEHYFAIAAFQDKTTTRGVTRHVRVSAGGSVKYTLCEP